MVVLCSNRRRTSYKRNRHKHSCWRNPCVVFFLTFASIGSLRLFRVPARSKQLLIKSRESWRTRQQNKRNMFNYRLILDQEEPQRLRKYTAVRGDGQPISVDEWARTVATEATNGDTSRSVAGLIKIFSRIPYKAVFFETPAIKKSSMGVQPFEFVLVDAPNLATKSPDPAPFAEHFRDSKEEAVAFKNLSGSSLLVAPTPNNASTMLPTHLASFMRTATVSKIQAGWKKAAESYLDSVATEDNVWFSTSGLGVYWLHFRFDDRPKYYTYIPYRSTS